MQARLHRRVVFQTTIGRRREGLIPSLYLNSSPKEDEPHSNLEILIISFLSLNPYHLLLFFKMPRDCLRKRLFSVSLWLDMYLQPKPPRLTRRNWSKRSNQRITHHALKSAGGSDFKKIMHTGRAGKANYIYVL